MDNCSRPVAKPNRTWSSTLEECETRWKEKYIVKLFHLGTHSTPSDLSCGHLHFMLFFHTSVANKLSYLNRVSMPSQIWFSLFISLTNLSIVMLTLQISLIHHIKIQLNHDAITNYFSLNNVSNIVTWHIW